MFMEKALCLSFGKLIAQGLFWKSNERPQIETQNQKPRLCENCLMIRVLALGLFLVLLSHLGFAQQADITLQAKWPATPLLLEAAEFLVSACPQCNSTSA